MVADISGVITWLISILYMVQYLMEITISVIIVVITFLINRFIIQKSINTFGEKTSLDFQHIKPLKKITFSIVWIVTFFIILSVFGFRDILWGMFAAAGFAGIVVGMATQNVISDMVTGFLLIIYRPFKIGDSRNRRHGGKSS